MTPRVTSKHNDPPPGRCPACGYPKDGGTCPECGTHSEMNQLVPLEGWTRRQRLTLLLSCTAAVLLTIGVLITMTGGWIRLLPDRALVLMRGGAADARIADELAARLYDGALSTRAYESIVLPVRPGPGMLTVSEVERADRSSDKLELILSVTFRLPPPFNKPIKYCVVPTVIDVAIDGDAVLASEITAVSDCRRYIRLLVPDPKRDSVHFSVAATVRVQFPDRPDVRSTDPFEITAEADVNLRSESAPGRESE